jgi:hypothetical protein
MLQETRVAKPSFWRCAGVDAKHPVSPLFGWRLKPSSTRSPTPIELYARCQRWHMCFGRSRGRQRVDIPAVRSGSRAWNEIIAALRTGALIPTFRRAAPVRCGAFGDARRIVVGDGGGSLRPRNVRGHPKSAGSSSARVRVHRRVVRSGRCGVDRWRGPRRLLRFTRPIARTDKTPSSPRRAQRRLSVALRPRVAARSAMSGASLPATADARRRRTLNAHPVPRAVRLRRLPQARNADCADTWKTLSETTTAFVVPNPVRGLSNGLLRVARHPGLGAPDRVD